MLDETIITKAIIESYTQDLINNLHTDVIIAGAGPAGLVASKFLADAGLKTIIFERKLSIGGGMLGGGMMFNKIVVQTEAKRILDIYDIKLKEIEKGYFVADAIESVGKLTAGAIDAGVKIFNLISVEDVKIDGDFRITGAVINWTAVGMAKLHVDPLTFESRCVIDATGHDLEVVNVALRKIPNSKIDTPTGEIMGELSMNAEIGEKILLETTKEVYPGLYVAGMAANACSGGQRMGPIFGGMLLSGEKVANLIINKFKR
ncbi:MAG: thiazole biosynthesis protein [Candidatus Lokiarchaeota archaeon]|nr:thiazole biosynthesis protein [Candidatus Lokiarchaeota archaeon]MBD3200079.1 thiazole biosynthesis protein [Candidatus Lokiarchaeota archaeon]